MNLPTTLLFLPSKHIKDRRSFPKTYGLYFVVKWGRVYYVGLTTTSFRKRWSSHDRTRQAERIGATVKFYECHCGDAALRELERNAIARWRPKWNGTPVRQQRRRSGVMTGIVWLGCVLLAFYLLGG